MSPVKTEVKNVVSRITGDLTSRGKVSAHWSFEKQAEKVQIAVRSDDGMFNAQQNLTLDDIKELKEWLTQAEASLS